ncbi:MAG: HAMP domain-containing protein, partial [Deltaproteobacteria bacterium]|nr:HAMP domain-containing protein [Deltaproteobacteria bacterium]
SIQKMDNGIDHSINSKSLKRTIEQYTNDVGIKNPVVVDSSLTILSHEQEKIVYKKSRDPDLKQAIHSGSTIKKFRPYLGKEHLSISAPFFQSNKIMGAIKIMLPLDDVEEGMVDYRQTVLLFTISTAFTFIIIGSFLLTRYLVKPLERMIKATEDITEGYFPQNMEPTGRNEIGTLSASLSRMSHKLEEDKKQIEQYITSLEDSNKKLKKAQDEVLRSEKLASVGKLAAGIAHEIGNPIGIIIGYVEILRQNTSPKEENLDMLKRVENEIMRIDKIIRELLGFSHPSKAALHPIQLNPLIEEAASLISHQKAFHDIELDLRLQDGLPFITADEQQFQQVMINLFINAMDAMQGG